MLHNIFLETRFNDIARRFGATGNFATNLGKSNDWEFIIKLCIFTEDVCTDSLIRHFNDDNLKTWLTKLPLIGGQTGKLPLLKNLKLIDSDDENFIQGIADIRNRYAHRIKYADLSLIDYVNSLPNEESKKIKCKFKAATAIIGKDFDSYSNQSIYWRFALETCFVITATKLTQLSGLAQEIDKEHDDFINLLKDGMKNA